MMKRKKSIILIIISLVLIAIVGIISYNLSRKEISIQQIQGSATSTANADTTTTNYTLTFVNRDMTIVLNATNSDTLQSKYEEAEQKFNDTYTNPFATYIENGHKYVFKDSTVSQRWSKSKDRFESWTAGFVCASKTLYPVYEEKAIETGDFNLTFVNRDMSVDLYATSSNSLSTKMDEAEKKLIEKYPNSFDDYIENGYKYAFSGELSALSRWSPYEDRSLPTTSDSITKDDTYYAIYNKTAINYSITYEGMENTTCDENPTSYTVETETITLNNPTKTGYKFIGWTGSNGETPQTTVTIPKGSTGDKVYTANWEKNYDYKITLYPDNGENFIYYLFVVKTGDKRGIYKNEACDEDQKVVANTDGQIKVPKKTGYIFTGYGYEGENANYISNTGSISDTYMDILIEGVSNNIEFKARWELIKYKIILNKNDGTDTKEYLYVKYGDGIYKDENYQDKYNFNGVGVTIDKIPTREGYTFEGFTNDPDGNGNIEINSSGDTASWGYSSLINKDTTEDYNLYAKWKLKQYRIVLNKNDDTLTKDYLYVKYGDGIYKDENYQQPYEFNDEEVTIDKIPTRDGYIFNGFYSLIYGYINFEIDSTGTISIGTWNYLVNKDTTEDYNLYADWGVILPEIEEVRGNPETWTNQDVTLSVVVNQNQQLADKPFSFDGGVTWQSENKKTYTENTSGIEVWVKDSNGYIGIYPTTINIDKIDKDPPVFTLIPLEDGIYGYSIAAEDLKGSGVASCEVNGIPLTVDESGDYSFIIEKSGTYTIKVTDYAGNSTEETETFNIPSDDKVDVTGVTLDKTTLNLKVNETGKLNATITPENATNKNVTFSSSDDSIAEVSGDGVVTAKKAGTATITVTTEDGNKTATCNVTVTDKTNPETKIYTVKFDSNGGTGTMPDQKFTMDVAQNLTTNTFTRTGYTFVGWNTKADGTGISYSDSASVTNLTTTNNGIVTLFAQWNGNQATYKVEYYKQQEDGSYKIAETENKTGVVGEIVTAEKKTYEGYKYNSSESKESGVVLADDSLVLIMKYNLNNTIANFIVKYYKEDGSGKYTEVKEDEKKETGTIGEKVTAKVKAYEGYMYNSEKSKESISGVVKEDGSLALEVYYRKLKAPYMEITVKDSSTQEIKEGVKVTLYDGNGKETLTMVSDIIGKVAFEGLEQGKTYIYKIDGDSKEYKVKVTEDGKIEYINEEEPKDDPKDDPEEKPGDNSGDKTDSDSSKKQDQISGQTDNTKATSTIPKAGITGKVILFVVVLLAGVIGISYIKYKRLNKIC